MAWLEERPSGYLVRWRDPQGRKRQAFFPDQAEALTFAHSRSPRPHRPSRKLTSLEVYMRESLASAEDLRESTRYHYKSMARKHIFPAIGHLALAEVEGPELRSFFVAMRDAGYSRSYRAVARHLLARTFRYALADGLVERNPLDAVPSLAAEYRREVNPLDVGQVERLADGIRPRYRAAVLVMAYAGLRIGEVGALTITNVNLLHRELRVQSGVARAGGRLIVSATKTPAGRRTVPIPRFLADELGFHLDIHGLAPDGRVFHTPGVNQYTDEYGLLHASSLHKPFKEARRRARLPRVTPHTLRHTYAAFLTREGAHPKVIQTLMGHTSIKVTMDLYGHLFPGMGKEMAERLDDLRTTITGGGNDRGAQRAADPYQGPG
jgi:integrase